MTNEEKQQLATLVKIAIKDGLTLTETAIHLRKYGYTIGTIKRYYNAFRLTR